MKSGEGWNNIKNVINMESMFEGAESLIGFIKWNVKSVTT